MEPVSLSYAFGPFVLDRSRRLLWRDGSLVSLTPKAFDILSLLVERSGAVVEKDAIFRTVWPDTVVDEGSLTFQISALRKALGERAAGKRYIATIPGRGYQLAAPVRKVAPSDVETYLEVRSTETVTVEQARGWELPSRPLTALILLVVIGLAAAAFWLVQEREAVELVSGPAEIRSIAILPFKPIVASQRDEALEIGMADTLITRLSHLPRVDVRPTAAVRDFGDLDQDPLEAARRLKVDAVLDGTIHRSGDRIRVSARLFRIADGATLWARQFDDRFTNLFDVQDRISKEVADSLSSVLSSADQERLAARSTSNVEAWEHYVKGIYFVERDSAKAIAFFEQALSHDPRYAAAWAGIAQASLQSGRYINSPPREPFERAREAALTALELDPRLPQAHAALGAVYADHDWAWSKAEDSYRRALALEEASYVAHNGYGLTLLYQRKFEQSIRHLERARELDPVSLSGNIALGMALRFAGRFEESIAQLEETLELYPSLVPARLHLGMALANSGRPEEAIAQFQAALDAGGDQTQLETLLAYAAALAGREERARAILREIEENAADRDVASFNMALPYSALDEPDRAFYWLDRALEERLYLLRTIHVEQGYEPLRNDPRYHDLIRRLGFEAEAE